MMKEEYECHYSNMSFSDYKVRHKRLYEKDALEIFHKYFKLYSEQWTIPNHRDVYEVDVGNIWFAEYMGEADFSWHCHEACNMSAVIQLVLDDSSKGTEFYPKELNIPLTEGDIVFFPAMIPHRGPPIDNSHKIIVGINFNMY